MKTAYNYLNNINMPFVIANITTCENGEETVNILELPIPDEDIYDHMENFKDIDCVITGYDVDKRLKVFSEDGDNIFDLNELAEKMSNLSEEEYAAFIAIANREELNVCGAIDFIDEYMDDIVYYDSFDIYDVAWKLYDNLLDSIDDEKLLEIAECVDIESVVEKLRNNEHFIRTQFGFIEYEI